VLVRLLHQSVSVHQYSIELRGLEIHSSKDGITNPDQWVIEKFIGLKILSLKY